MDPAQVEDVFSHKIGVILASPARRFVFGTGEERIGKASAENSGSVQENLGGYLLDFLIRLVSPGNSNAINKQVIRDRMICFGFHISPSYS